MIKMVMCLSALTIVSAIPWSRKTDIYLGNGRWAPIAGAVRKPRHNDQDYITQESRSVRVIAKPPKFLVHSVYREPDAHIKEEVEYAPIPYQFGYGFHDHAGHHHDGGNQQWRHEVGDENGGKRGSYGYKDAHGIYRHVDYVADQYGYRATIRTNEPGVSNQNPASVTLQIDRNPLSSQQTYEQPIKTAKPRFSAVLPFYRSNRIRKLSRSNIKRTDMHLNQPEESVIHPTYFIRF